MGEENKNQEGGKDNQEQEKPLDEMTVKELRKIAKDIPGITGLSAMKKDELLAEINKARKTEEPKEEKKTPEEKVPEKPLEKMTVKELKDLALKIPGLEGVTAMKKDELLAVIKEERGIKEEKPAKKKKKKIAKTELSVKELKGKILQLREEKRAAREANDRHRIDILRRRINRLKKRTRKVVVQG
jgi:hypothetical protein